jgi:hypothetical protein
MIDKIEILTINGKYIDNEGATPEKGYELEHLSVFVFLCMCGCSRKSHNLYIGMTFAKKKEIVPT